METDRFSSKEDFEGWNEEYFNQGHQARCDGHSQKYAPNRDVIGHFCHQSWMAGWCDADSDKYVREHFPLNRE